MNSQSPIYSFKFTISWIFIYLIIVIIFSKLINIFLAAYLGLWILNLLIEVAERLLLRFGRRIYTVERWDLLKYYSLLYLKKGRLAQSGRALPRQGRCHKFKSCISHKLLLIRTFVNDKIYIWSIQSKNFLMFIVKFFSKTSNVIMFI